MKKQLSFVGPISADTVEHLFDTDAPIRPEPAAARAPYGGRARRDQRNLIVALDIGTSKVVALVADLTLDGRLEVIGMGTHESRGLKKGVVVNIEATVNAIQRALEEAELMADCKIQRVYTGIAGSHIRSFNSTGMVAVKDKEVTPLDIDRAIETARAMPIPTDQQVLHILTQEFLIDGQDGIREPLGMSGVRLEVEVHIVTGTVTSVQNVVRSGNRAGLAVQDIVLEPLASAEAVLFDDEKELGVVVIDIGGGTTDVALLRNGAVWHTVVLPLGGDHITNDIAIGLRTPTADAEGIKKRYGCALTALVPAEETVDVPSVGGRKPRQLSRQLLSEIIQPRVEEIFTLVARDLARAGFQDAATAGVVVTGGTSIMEGVPELAEGIFDQPVRRGVPIGIGGLTDIIESPIYATGVGLALYGARTRVPGESAGTSANPVGRFARLVTGFLGDLF
jgi:cell division protein FtsA